MPREDRRLVLILVRSVAFNLAFYLNTAFWLVVALPTFFMPFWAIVEIARIWGKVNLVLLRVICGIKVEIRGREKIPQGPLLVASKHQSAWETFALVTLFPNPVFILKRELQWIPIFGWFTIKGRMVPVDRGRGAAALRAMAERARHELAQNRQLIIFPEGTRRAAGAEPRYKYGVAHVYATAGVPCLPIALNSGLFWPRRTFRRYPGTVIVEICDIIPPGLDQQTFFDTLQTEIESATARLIEEGRQEMGRA
ncbi:MAG: 1-acyl-sn-glycerol-3-phosphate acyltransferase [Pseudolabrys sp.]|nr:1-acyl-sn-glycerol-3-phosphate acyltransferase [Pseudolabrys sp.]